MLGTVQRLVDSVQRVTCPLPPFFHGKTEVSTETEEDVS